jgi:hypothetical protein
MSMMGLLCLGGGLMFVFLLVALVVIFLNQDKG